MVQLGIMFDFRLSYFSLLLNLRVCLELKEKGRKEKNRNLKFDISYIYLANLTREEYYYFSFNPFFFFWVGKASIPYFKKS